MGEPTPPEVDQCLNPEEVQVGINNGPGIYLAPAGTAPPDTTEDDWEDPWHCLGYLSDDGPTVGSSTDTEDLTPWQSVAPIKSIITARSVTLQFVMWQLNAETLALYFDTDVPTAGEGGTLDMDVRTDQAGHTYAVGIDSRDGNRVLRVSFLRASLSDAGDMQITRGAVVPLDVTLSALESSGSLARVQLGPANPVAPLAASVNGTGASARQRTPSAAPAAAAAREAERARQHHRQPPAPVLAGAGEQS
jgi:hypothetical protein